MNKLLKMIFFICIFSYVFSIVEVTNIESSNVILGEKATFNLTVQNYYYSLFNTFYLGDNDIKDQISLSCNLINYTFLKCEADLNINKLEYLKNLTKILYTIDKVDTNKTVTINKPSILKLNDFKKSYNKYYSFGVSSFYFIVNYNELYNSSISIKFGDISITNCKKNETFNYINCIHEFPENHNNQTLKLIFNGVETNYSITIYAPPEFKYIEKLNKNTFYVSSTEQEIYFVVDSSYKMNENKIVLVPESPGNSNITLFSCSYYNDRINDAKCSVLLNTIDAYFVYVNDEKKTNLLIYVYPEQTMITKVNNINPNNITISSLPYIFILNVDYVVNLDKAVFTLVDEYNDTNKIYLTKCSKLDDLNINCLAKVKNTGNYYLYLNGIKQDEEINVNVYSLSLTKAVKIEPNLIKFESESKKYIKIYFDSIYNYSSKNITLKGNNTESILEFYRTYSNFIEFSTIFPATDKYYVYIDNEKQNESIEVTNKNYTSNVTSISPNIITFGISYTFILTVDTNIGINYIELYKKNFIGTDYIFLDCEPDSLNETKAICNAQIYYEGDYKLMLNNTKIENINVSVKNVPKLVKFFPFSFSPSSNSQNVIFYFENDVSNYVDNVTFVGAETLTPTCELNSNYVLNCSTVFNKEDKYYLYLDDVNIGRFINVNEKDNIIEEEIYEEYEFNENESSNGKNEIKDESESNENNSNNNSKNNNDDSNDDSNDNNGRIIKNNKNLLLLLLFLIF